MNTTITENQPNWSYGPQPFLTHELCAMSCRATQDRQVMVESSDKTWSTGEGNGKTLQCSCLENPMNSMKRQKGRTLKDELPRSMGAQYATREEWRNTFRKHEEMKPKWKQRQVVDVTHDVSKVQRCEDNTPQEPGMLGPWIKVNWKWSDRRCKEWTLTFQESVKMKMNWNGWI